MAVLSRVSGRALLALLIVAVTSSLLALAPTPTPAGAAAGDIKEVQLVDRVATPAWQLVLGDHSRYLGRNDLGLIADKYGTTSDPVCTSSSEGVCSDRGKYYDYQPFADGLVSGPAFEALLDVDGDSDARLDRLVVTTNGEVVLLGDRSTAYSSWLLNGNRLVTGTVLGAVTRADGFVGILTTTGIHVYFADFELGELHFVRDFDADDLGFDPALLLQVKQRQRFVQFATSREVNVGADGVFLALSRAGGSSDALVVREIQWNDDGTFMTIGAATVPQPAPVRDARMAYDWINHGTNAEMTVVVLAYADGVRDGHLSVIPAIESSTVVFAFAACPTDDPDATPSVEVQAIREGTPVNADDPEFTQVNDHIAYGCASVVDGSSPGSLSRLHRDVYQQRGRSGSIPVGFRWTQSEELNVGVTMHDPQLQLYFPCAAGLRAQTPAAQPDGSSTANPCAASGGDGGGGNGDTLASVLVAKRGDDAIDVWSRAWSPLAYHAGGLGGTVTGGNAILGDYRTLESGIPGAAGHELHVLPLDYRPVEMKVRITNRLHPETVTTDPIPLGLLVAPPYVRGAEQAMSAPEFAKSVAEGTTESRSTSVEVGVSVGGGYESGAFGAEITARLGVEWEHEETVSKEIERTDFFQGAEGENSIVYQAVVAHRYNAEVIESSDGLAYHDTFPLLFPVTTTTDIAAESTFRSLDGGGAGVRYGNALNQALPDAGNPSTYLTGGAAGSTVPSSQVNSYCNASRAHASATLAPNPFRPLPDVEPTDPGSSILLGHEAVVTAGPGASAVQGSEISITNSNSNSEALTLSVGVDAMFRVGGAQFGADVTAATGDGIENSTSNGTSFSAGVGDIPSADLASEGYRWKTFLCKRNLVTNDGARLPVWVLNYTVDDYSGSGGLEDQSEVELTSPIHSAFASRTPNLTWSQDTGTMKEWKVQLEAIGAADARVFDPVLSNATTEAGNAAGPNYALPWSTLGQSTPLLPGQLYRWRVTGTDFFGHQTVSDDQFFVTNGPVSNASLSVSDPTPDIGESVTLTANYTTNGSPPTNHRWQYGDGLSQDTGLAKTISHTWGLPGAYPVQVTIQTAEGDRVAQTLVSVGPAIGDDSYTVAEDGQLAVPAPGVLDNDSGALTSTRLTNAAHGTVSMKNDGSFTYTPFPDYCGIDRFNYGAGGGPIMRIGMVEITVTCVDDAPLAQSFAVSAVEDTTFAVARAHPDSLFSHSSDADTDVGSITHGFSVVSNVGHGTLAVTNAIGSSERGAWTYTPDPDFCGTDSFTWRVQESGAVGGLQSDVATTTIDVACVPDAPVAVDGPTVAVAEDGILSLRSDHEHALYHNVTDPDGVDAASHQFQTVSNVSHGILVALGDGFEYRPTHDYCGPDSFQWRAVDDHGSGLPSNAATQHITVTCVADAPLAQSFAVSAVEDTTFAVARAHPDSLFSHSSDADTDVGSITHGFSVVSNVGHGTLAVTNAIGSSERGAWTYTPDPDFCGTDSFTWRVQESGAVGGLQSDVATTTIDVACVNDAPVAIDGTTASATEDTDLMVFPGSADALHLDITDIDEAVGIDTHTFEIVSGASHGSSLTSGTTAWSYRPVPDYCGPDSFTWRARDAAGAWSNEATQHLDVACVNDPPIAGPDGPVTVDEDTDVAITPVVADIDGDDLTIAITTEPEHGTAVVEDGGTILYTPDADYCGADSLAYTSSDADLTSAPSTVSITVTCQDEPTTVVEDSTWQATEDTVLDEDAPGLLAHATSPGGRPLTAVVSRAPFHGTVVVRPDGSFTYTPAADVCGTDSFTWRADDGEVLSDRATATVEVACVNDPPTAGPDEPVTTDEDTAVAITPVTADVDDSDLTIAITTGPEHGTAVVEADRTITYTPAADYCGSDSFAYTASDGEATSAASTVAVEVTCLPEPPKVADSSWEATEDTALEVAAPGLLEGATDADSATAALTAALADGAEHGTVTVAADGGFTYTPLADFCGTDAFTFVADDGDFDSQPGTATVEVACVNDPPTAGPDEPVTTDEDTAVAITPVTADVDDSDLTIAITTGPEHGTAVVEADGTITYTPAADYCGSDSLAYTASDGDATTAPSVVAITVTCRNDGPVVAPQPPVTVDEDDSTVITPDATDPDDPDAELEVLVATGPEHGTAVVEADGSITYTPTPDYCGADAFTFTVGDGEVTSAPVDVAITVTCVNDPPVVAPEPPVTFEEDGTIVVTPDITDPDDPADALEVEIVVEPEHGTAVVGEDGTITYTPDADACGADSFGYVVTDGDGGSSEVVTVSITVTCVNDAPVAVDDSPDTNPALRVDQGQTVALPAPGLLANDTDADGDTLTPALASAASHGAVTVAPDGSFTWTPAAGFCGTDSFVYSVSDGQGGTDTATVTVQARCATKVEAAPLVIKVVPGIGLYLLRFEAKVTGADGAPVAGVPVTFVLAGQDRCTATTDTNGVATCAATVQDTLAALLNPYTARFDGDAGRQPASGRSSLLTLGGLRLL